MPPAPARYVLGLDLGSASLGWALIDPEGKQIVKAGVRVFDPGVDPQTFERGIEGSSNNVARRQARLHRRQLRRRAARQQQLFLALQNAGLLPPSGPHLKPGASEARYQVLKRLDSELRSRWLSRLLRENPGIPAPEQVLPYFLRARALDERLAPDELGRALYHLGQRRGYKSNRKEARKVEANSEKNHQKPRPAPRKVKDDPGVVDAGIQQLQSQIAESGARTLAEFFYRVDPAAHRIRARWTSRKMFEDEFDQIWQKQSAFLPGVLTSALKSQLCHLLFYQRPIAANEHLIGKCGLEPAERRAPMAHLHAQRFRLLQKVNDLELVSGDSHADSRQKLSDEQRHQLSAALQAQKTMTFAGIRKLLGVPKDLRFNLEAGGEKQLKGNRTSCDMQHTFGDQWHSFTPAQQGHIVDVWLRYDDEERLAQRGGREFALSPEAAERWARSRPEDGYSRLSLKALAKILPLMEQGVPFKTAEKQVYPEPVTAALDRLPPVHSALPSIPNPAVMRALTELRKIVNTIVRRFGKPAEVRLELARDIKGNAKQRRAAWENMRGREKERNSAERWLQENGHPKPSRSDIEKVLLFRECKEVCVYCGQGLGPFAALFDGALEKDHILPQNRFADDSFLNKVLVHRNCNQSKQGRTPYECWGSDPATWDEIRARVKKISPEKWRRFLIASDQELEEFSNRRMNDTRYATTSAARYLGLLYGGRDLRQPDGSSKRVIFASSGFHTATLRRGWGLEKILRQPEASFNGLNPGKPRTDHRHHAIDALVVALTSNRAIQQISRAAQLSGADPRFSRALPAPWPDFIERVRPHIERMNISHRPEHNLNGPLHDETNYSRERKPDQSRRVRKWLHSLSPGKIQAIVDPAVRAAAQAKLQQLDGDPRKFENDPPCLQTRKGKLVPIHRARIRVSEKIMKVGQGARQRYVSSAGNHHICIFAVRGKKGVKWETPGVVSRHEAMERLADAKKAGRPPVIIERSLPGQDAEFLFDLMGGDMVEIDDAKGGGRGLFVVRTISQSTSGAIEIDLVHSRDARKVSEMKATKDWDRITSIDELRKRNCRKVEVDHLGDVHYPEAVATGAAHA